MLVHDRIFFEKAFVGPCSNFGRRFVQSGLVFDVTRRFFTTHLSFSAAIALRVRHFDFVAEITESVSKSERKCNG